MKYLRAPYQTLLDASQRYGDPYVYPSTMGPLLMTADPVGIRSVFSADHDSFRALGAELLAPVLGESNVILLSGDRHRAMRKLMAPPFHGARMRVYGQLIADTAAEYADKWPRDRSFEVHRTMQEISLDVILQAVLGLSAKASRESFKQKILAVVSALKPTFLFIPALRRSFFGMSAWARYLKIREQLATAFQEELAKRRAQTDEGTDILSLLLSARYDDGSSLTEEELLIQMMSLIVAGHETTASALAWALYHIHRDPAIHERLRKEILSVGGESTQDSADLDALAHLPYLDAVCSETLRLNPIAPSIGRTLQKPLHLLGYDLPPGTQVGISIIACHRNPALYRQPDRFLPERFLDRSYSPFEFLPFGGGARRCIGAAFALSEMKIVLFSILRKFNLRVCQDIPKEPVVRNTTVGPARGVWMAHA